MSDDTTTKRQRTSSSETTDRTLVTLDAEDGDHETWILEGEPETTEAIREMFYNADDERKIDLAYLLFTETRVVDKEHPFEPELHEVADFNHINPLITYIPNYKEVIVGRSWSVLKPPKTDRELNKKGPTYQLRFRNWC